MKPLMTDAQLDNLKHESLGQISQIHKTALAFGWVAIGLTLGAAVLALVVPVEGGVAGIIIMAVTHWRFRDRFGDVPALAKVDLYDMTPGPELRALESDPECHAAGIFIRREDWPELFKDGLRVWMRESIETFEIKVLNFTTYAFLLFVCFK